MSTLQSLLKAHVKFDPSDAEHRRAYLFLLDGRQHPTLRFQQEEPYQSVLAMMQAKLASWACDASVVLVTTSELKIPGGKVRHLSSKK